MRMLHYFALLGALVVPGLLATAALGLSGKLELHLKVGLLAAISAVGLHTLVILFMIVTGRVLREAVRVRELPREFLDELNEFFARKAAYPAAVFASVAIVFAGVAGYAVPALGLPLWVHPLAGGLAVLYNLWAVLVEFGALRENRDLIDRAARLLDRIDTELEERGELPEPVDQVPDASRIARWGAILAISPLGAVRTILTTRFIPAQIRNRDHVAIDIDTGHYFVTNNALSGNRPVYQLTQSGTVTTWNTGQGTVWRGWDGEYSMLQNHRNGFLESAALRDVFQLRPGASAPTTLATLPSSAMIFYGSAGFDLQTAARPRWVLTGTTPTLSGTVLYTMDRSTFAVTSMAVRNRPYSSTWIFNMDFAFYRGRHLQTVRTGSRRWDIRLSMPRFAGKTYLLAAGLSGVRPGIPLPDGRRINLNPDNLVVLTLGSRIPAVFRPGPGVLDSAGEAVGKLDLSASGTLGIPIWLAAAVLDPAAPWGIAYLPDTVVMRI